MKFTDSSDKKDYLALSSTLSIADEFAQTLDSESDLIQDGVLVRGALAGCFNHDICLYQCCSEICNPRFDIY